jgi:hypothetical protein
MWAPHAPTTTPTRRQRQQSGQKSRDIPVIGGLQVIDFLNLIADGQRAAIDPRLQAIFNRLIA